MQEITFKNQLIMVKVFFSLHRSLLTCSTIKSIWVSCVIVNLMILLKRRRKGHIAKLEQTITKLKSYGNILSTIHFRHFEQTTRFYMLCYE